MVRYEKKFRDELILVFLYFLRIFDVMVGGFGVYIWKLIIFS